MTAHPATFDDALVRIREVFAEWPSVPASAICITSTPTR